MSTAAGGSDVHTHNNGVTKHIFIKFYYDYDLQ